MKTTGRVLPDLTAPSMIPTQTKRFREGTWTEIDMGSSKEAKALLAAYVSANEARQKAKLALDAWVSEKAREPVITAYKWGRLSGTAGTHKTHTTAPKKDAIRL